MAQYTLIQIYVNTRTLTLIAAMVAAISSLISAFYTQRSALELEKSKWAQSREDDARRNQRIVLADFAKNLAGAVQRAAGIVWIAINDPQAITTADFVSYDRESRTSLPDIVSSNVLVAADDKAAYDRLAPLLRDYYVLDERISKAGVAFRKNPGQGLTELQSCSQQARQLEASLPEAFAAIVAGEQNQSSK